MDASRVNDVEDWDRLKRVMDTLGPITVLGDVPRTEGGDDSHVVENIPSSREELLREEASHGRSSKKKNIATRMGQGRLRELRDILTARGKGSRRFLKLLIRRQKLVMRRCLSILSIN